MVSDVFREQTNSAKSWRNASPILRSITDVVWTSRRLLHKLSLRASPIFSLSMRTRKSPVSFCIVFSNVGIIYVVFYVCPVLRCACHGVKYDTCKWPVLILLTLSMLVNSELNTYIAFYSTTSFSSDRQHLSYNGCLEVRGKIIGTVLCCIVYWICAVISTHRWVVLTVLWIGLCHTILLCIDSFVFISVYFVFFLYCIFVVLLWVRLGGPDGIEA